MAGAATQREFSILDFDHAYLLAAPKPITRERVVEGLRSLRAPAVSLFDKASTEHARRVWGGH